MESGGVTPRVLTDDELAALPEAYAATARLAQQAGFDGVDVKCCHGYLPVSYTHLDVYKRQEIDVAKAQDEQRIVAQFPVAEGRAVLRRQGDGKRIGQEGLDV